MRSLPLVLALTLMLGLPARGSAHGASDSYLALAQTSGSSLAGHWDVSLRDLTYALTLDDGDGDGVLTWGELRAREGQAKALLGDGLTLVSAGSACAIRVEALQIVQLSDGPYARIPFVARCAAASSVQLSSQLLARVDRDHRVLLRFGQGDRASTHVLARQEPQRVLALGRSPGRASHMLAFALQLTRGLGHIFAGTDHVAFLLVLLLPAVFRKSAQPLPARVRTHALVLEIAKLVTAFTLAHSLTLSLAALGVVRASAQVIEPAIAASVALAALRNLLPRMAQEGSLFAFALGLLHGFGFSSALADAGLSGAALVSALLGFNFGVELGQLAIVALFVPLALLLRRVSLCRDHALPWGSAGVLALALFWLFERLQTG